MVLYAAFATALTATAQPVVNIPPDPFPDQEFFDDNPMSTVNIEGDVQFNDPLSFDFNDATINVNGSFNDSFVLGPMTHSNATFNIRGDVGFEGANTLYENTSINMFSGTLAEVEFGSGTVFNLMGGNTLEDIDASGDAIVNITGGTLRSDATSDYRDSSHLNATSGAFDTGGGGTGSILGFDNATAFIGGSIEMDIGRIDGFSQVVIAGGLWPTSDDTFEDGVVFSGQDVEFRGVDFLVDGDSLGLEEGDTFSFDESTFTNEDVAVALANGNILRPEFDTGNFTFTAIPTPGSVGLTGIVLVSIVSRRRGND